MKYPYALGRILGYFPDLIPADVLRQLRRTTFISLEKQFFYFAVPKAACTQMKELLRTIENAPPIRAWSLIGRRQRYTGWGISRLTGTSSPSPPGASPAGPTCASTFARSRRVTGPNSGASW